MNSNRVKKKVRQRVVEPARRLNVNFEDVSFDPSEGEVRGLVTVDSDTSDRALELLVKRENGDTELTVTYRKAEETVEFEAEVKREEHDDNTEQDSSDNNTDTQLDTQ